MDELAKLQFQLEQVQERLKQRPSDGVLLELEEKLKRLIDLSKRLSEAPKSTLPSKSANKDSGSGASPLLLAQGVRCEARFEGNQWFEAVVQSANEGSSTYTVVFTGTAEALHCSPADIRPFRPGLTQKKAVGGLAPAQDKKRIAGTKDPSTLGDSSKKVKYTREEHAQKKEIEHREKQEAWKKFSQKYGITKK